MTVRSRAALLALFPDNTTGDAEPVDVRDLIDSIPLSTELGLGGVPYTFFDVDMPPASAHALDDEGTGTAGAAVAGFTAANAGGSTLLYDGKGRMRLATPATDGDSPRFYYKATPAGSWTLTAKLTANLFSGFGTVGIAAQDSATGKLILIGLQIRNGFDLCVITQKWTNLTTFSSEAQTGGFGSTIYVQMTWNGTNLTTRWSRDGLTDFRTHIGTDTFVGTPNRIGISVNSNGAADSSGVFEFWRVKAATSDTVGDTRTVSGQSVATAEVLISEQIVGVGGAASVNFTGIPTTYRDLRLVVRGRGSKSATAASVFVRVNGDTGNNYDYEISEENGTTQAAAGSQAVARWHIGYIAAATTTADSANACECRMYNYRNTLFHKAMLANAGAKVAQSGGGDLYITRIAAWWRSTAAINAVLAFPDTGNFNEGTVVSLYGIY